MTILQLSRSITTSQDALKRLPASYQLFVISCLSEKLRRRLPMSEVVDELDYNGSIPPHLVTWLSQFDDAATSELLALISAISLQLLME